MAPDGDGDGGELGTDEVDEEDGDWKRPASGPCCWALER
jgi:hypothetical protein